MRYSYRIAGEERVADERFDEGRGRTGERGELGRLGYQRLRGEGKRKKRVKRVGIRD